MMTITRFAMRLERVAATRIATKARRAMALVTVLIGGLAVSTPAAAFYIVRDLGSLPGGDYSSAVAVNNSSVAAGMSFDSVDDHHAVLWSPNGSIADLGATFGDASSEAFDVNDLGQAVGNAAQEAVLWSGGSQIALDAVGYQRSEARGINDLGQVVGWVRSAGDYKNHLFIWQDANGNGVSDPGEMQFPYGPDVDAIALGINDAGQVVGQRWFDGAGQPRGFLKNGPVTKILGTLGGTSSLARAINASGQVVGTAQNLSGLDHAFLWTPSVPNGTTGIMTDLGALASYPRSEAFDINDQGAIVGRVRSNTGVYRAVIFTNAGPKDLNSYISASSGWTLLEARGINNSGWIVGRGLYNGESRAFMLIPLIFRF
jgi:probable HAF family extracellular repeat protein